MAFKLGFQRVSIDAIIIPKSHRTHLHGAVAKMKDSMDSVGQLNPVLLRPDGTLVAGAGRIAGATARGEKTIEAIVREFSDAEAVLAMHHENMRRNQYTTMEEAVALAQCKKAYEELHPETKAGTAGAVAKHGQKTQDSSGNSASATVALAEMQDSSGKTPSFAEKTASETNRSVRAIQLETAIGEGLTDAAKVQLHDTPVADSPRQLATLAKLPPKKQEAVANLIGDGKAKSVNEALDSLEKRRKPSKNGKPTADVRMFKDLEQKIGAAIRANSAIKAHCGGADHHEVVRQHLNSALKEIAAWRRDALKT